MNGQDIEKELEYFISEKGSFLVLSLMGPLTKNSKGTLDKCKSEVLQSQTKNVIISLHDVPYTDPGAVPPLVQLQMAIRQKPAQLRVCFVRPDLQKFLLEKAAIRNEEITSNLQAALHSLGALRKK
jgi:anti-anti-sigma regulatory factor